MDLIECATGLRDMLQRSHRKDKAECAVVERQPVGRCADSLKTGIDVLAQSGKRIVECDVIVANPLQSAATGSDLQARSLQRRPAQPAVDFTMLDRLLSASVDFFVCSLVVEIDGGGT